MKRRAISMFIIFTLAFSGLLGRIYYISEFQYADAAVLSHSRVEYFGSNRGLIFDCNMQKLVEDSEFNYTSSYDENMIIKGIKRYSENCVAPHIIGYLNGENIGVSGIEKDYNSFLSSIRNEIKVIYNSDAKGNQIKGKSVEISDAYINRTDGVVTTLDKDISLIVRENAASLKKGAVVILNSSNGDIKTMESFPSFNQNFLEKSLNNQDEPFINRCISNYSVGSIFKIIVCAAALENGIKPDFSYNCTGNIDCGGKHFNCHKADGHKLLDMNEAVQKSCNTYFINLAQKIGFEKITDMCRKFKIDEKIVLSSSIIAKEGNIPDSRVLSSPAGLANFSFGQGELLSSPVEFCRVYSCIDNGGFLVTPSLITGTVEHGSFKSTVKTEKTKIISADTASRIKSFLTDTVKFGTGKNANSIYTQVSGKTATAQTGKFSGNKEILHSYFVGSFRINNESYTMLIMKEEGTSGSSDCAPIFKDIVDGIYQLKTNCYL